MPPRCSAHGPRHGGLRTLTAGAVALLLLPPAGWWGRSQDTPLGSTVCAWAAAQATSRIPSLPQRWVGVLAAYLLRPSAASVARREEFRRLQGWSHPVVGVHIRRTDKLESEAKAHSVAEYMGEAERMCDQLLPSGWAARAAAATAAAASQAQPAGGLPRERLSECSVYLASDEPQVAAEVREAYPHIFTMLDDRAMQAGEAHGK
jgi:hypothetical protein